MEFTFVTYKRLLTAFLENNYKICRVDQYFQETNCKILFLRHDVDRFPNNALKMASDDAKLAEWVFLVFFQAKTMNGMVIAQVPASTAVSAMFIACVAGFIGIRNPSGMCKPFLQ